MKTNISMRTASGGEWKGEIRWFSLNAANENFWPSAFKRQPCSHFPEREQSKYHRIKELFELEGTLEGHLVQLPCNEWGHPQLHRELRASHRLVVQPYSSRNHCPHISAEPVPVPHHPSHKNLPYIQSKSPSFHLKNEFVSLCPVMQTLVRDVVLPLALF